MRLEREKAALLLVDLQERLAAAMPPEVLERVVKNVVALVEGAKVLGLPILVTEQYPKGIGPTLAAIREVLPPDVTPIAKVEFSCLSAAGVAAELERLGRRQLVLAGMETHICVFQTARDLVGSGHAVFVPHDAVASRSDENRRVGLALAEKAGATVTATEAVLFDLLGKAGTPEFKAISALIR